METHFVLLFIDRNTLVCFDSFGNKYIPEKLLSKIKGKSFTQNKFKIPSDNFVMIRFYFIAFMEYMLAGKTFLDYKNSFSFFFFFFVAFLKINDRSLQFRLKK